MSHHHHVVTHVIDATAVVVAWLSVSFTLAGVQSVSAIVASLLSGTYLAIRIATDPAVQRWIAKLRGK